MGRALFWTMLLVAMPVFAALGDSAASVEADRVQMKAQSRADRLPSYTVHEMLTAEGVTVREYVAPDGKVFAVTWNGPRIPDLQLLFGDHFTTFQQAARGIRGRGPLRVDTPGLVVRSAGHMRSFGGRAYLPQDIPAGVSTDDIK